MNTDLIGQMEPRGVIRDYLFNQIHGPTNTSLFAGEPLPPADMDGRIYIPEALSSSTFHDPLTGFTLLQNSRPEMVFGTGVLHSPEEVIQLGKVEEITDDLSQDDVFPQPDVPDSKFYIDDDGSEESSSIDQSQKMRPSAMGMTANLVATRDTVLRVEVTGGIYADVPVVVEPFGSRTWYRKIPVSSVVEIAWSELADSRDRLCVYPLTDLLSDYVNLQIRWRQTDSQDKDGNPLIALTAVVSHMGSKKDDIFQVSLRVDVLNSGAFSCPDRTLTTGNENFEDQEIEFLYRHVNNFGFGHGTSVNWEVEKSGRVTSMFTESLPVFYQEVIDAKASGIAISMKAMYEESDEFIRQSLQNLIDEYHSWIVDAEEQISKMRSHQQPIGSRLAAKTTHICVRMQEGLDILFRPENAHVLKAFRYMNRAMYLQQGNGRSLRRGFRDEKDKKLSFPPRIEPDPNSFGTWRPFQIGFLLSVLPGVVDPLDRYREEVDLIFFPTGGGKTEAYLGAAALAIVLRRLEDPNHDGVDVLMRYTLRLLTVQQFERSAALITALEYLRRSSNGELGQHAISIGVWLGDKTTPNKRADAVSALNSKVGKEDGVHPFVLSKCPWCSAEFGLRISNKTWVGYRQSSSKPRTLKFICEDQDCDFSRESSALPIWITDEDVYDNRPSFILGTVDKFAQLAWQPQARAIFNIDSTGSRKGLPPSLIIQDELHLISGPLGSLVGLYEGVIEELCTYSVEGTLVRPKIIASTATTRRYQQQIRSLYGRSSVMLFPQAILRANETFFSAVKRGQDGTPDKGTAYVGVNAATYSTGQLAASQVSAFLSQAPNAWAGDPLKMDYYATSVWFFNSLKELGQTLTLMQSTVISLLNQMWRDRRIPQNKTRYLDPIQELTGRVSSEQISKALAALATPSSSKSSIRTCLASSIMEVGVDVQRLGLLTIMSQPKLTSQYIQVSGRVGRDPLNGPGLVIMLYNSGRARDRSVYENFFGYHRRLYAQVEPLSVTPFAVQTMEKGLAGALIALYRMRQNENVTPTQLDRLGFESCIETFRSRMEKIGCTQSQKQDFEAQVNGLIQRWERYAPVQWTYTRKQEEGSFENQATALLRRRSAPLMHIAGDSSIVIPQSMRNVDGQTKISASSNPYNFLQPAEEDK